MNDPALPRPGGAGTAADDPARSCRHLRTKMMFVVNDWEEHAAEYPSSTASYWCLKTMGPAGPDDDVADLEECRSGRACFQPQD
jgi:hypothetical protein